MRIRSLTSLGNLWSLFRLKFVSSIVPEPEAIRTEKLERTFFVHAA
jgi:hypothetical protein